MGRAGPASFPTTHVCHIRPLPPSWNLKSTALHCVACCLLMPAPFMRGLMWSTVPLPSVSWWWNESRLAVDSYITAGLELAWGKCRSTHCWQSRAVMMQQYADDGSSVMGGVGVAAPRRPMPSRKLPSSAQRLYQWWRFFPGQVDVSGTGILHKAPGLPRKQRLADNARRRLTIQSRSVGTAMHACRNITQGTLRPPAASHRLHNSTLHTTMPL
jgi:hypothetical protein